MDKKHNYAVALILNILSLLAALAGIVYLAYVYFYGTHIEIDAWKKTVEVAGASQTDLYIAIALCAFCVAQYVIFKNPLKKYMQAAIMDHEYDEFGRSKKKSFDNLTRQQREEMDLQKTAQMEMLLPTSVIKKITKKGSEHPTEDLNKLVGLTDVKQKVTEMTARMKFEMDSYKDAKKKDKKDKKVKDPRGTNGRHFVFYGNPGTGKTTVARIIAGYLYEFGYIKKNKVIEINGGFLKAADMSEQKTKMVIEQAYDGVLFIDEAYSIMEGSGQYGKAVIAELIKEMEDNRDRFTVILAGYRNDIKRLLDANEGFKSRIKEYLEFPDYNAQEMQQIFQDMAHDAGFVIDAGAMENYDERIVKERRLSSFGNGRTARNVLDECIDKHALNYGQGNLTYVDDNGVEHKNEESRYILRACDVSKVPNKAVL